MESLNKKLPVLDQETIEWYKDLKQRVLARRAEKAREPLRKPPVDDPHGITNEAKAPSGDNVAPDNLNLALTADEVISAIGGEEPSNADS